MIWKIPKWLFYMARESKYKVVIIGGGPAGCTCGYFLQKNFDVLIIDKKQPLLTLLPTGGGKCNLAHAEFDFNELVKNYPHGEKFLYSVFSRFGTAETIEFFENIGVKTYIRDDMRIFPISNSAKDVREKMLSALKNVRFEKEEVLRINDGFNVVTDKGFYKADFIVIAIGGHASYKLIEMLNHTIIPPRPSLTGLVTKEDFSKIAGVVVNDVLFTHKGVSGPSVYKISSLKSRDDFPYELSFDFLGEIDLQKALNLNPHRNIKNLLSDYVPKSFAEFILEGFNAKCHTIDGNTRDKISNRLKDFKITVVGTVKDGEVVTSGGVNLNEVNPKTLESKIIPKIYFCGEVLDIDGFCGGFNLQNCWSTGYLAAEAINSFFKSSLT